MSTIKNKVAVVTGSSSGIGRGIALKFAEEGSRIVITSRENDKEGKELVEIIKSSKGDAIYFQADLTQPDQVESLFMETKKVFGTVDILVNNAGRTIPQSFLETSKAHWIEQFETNLISTVLCSQIATNIMKNQRSGKIINTASVRGIGHCGREGIMAYSAAKAAVINFTKTLAKELAPYITVNAVAPGIVDTPYLKTVNDSLKKEWLLNIPLRKFISVSDLAEIYLLLAKSEILTGEVIVADAGFSLKIA